MIITKNSKDYIVYYPAIFIKTVDKHEPWFISFPDFPAHTEGKSIVDAMYQAKDAIGTMVCDRILDKEPVPKSNYDVSGITQSEQEFTVLVIVNIGAYQHKHHMK